MKYAVIKDGSHQYIVSKGDKPEVQLKQVKDEDQIEFKDVLLYVDGKKIEVGTPLVKGVTVTAKVETALIKDKKVTMVRRMHRTGYHTRRGHRQKYTVVKVSDITKA